MDMLARSSLVRYFFIYEAPNLGETCFSGVQNHLSPRGHDKGTLTVNNFLSFQGIDLKLHHVIVDELVFQNILSELRSVH